MQTSDFYITGHVISLLSLAIMVVFIIFVFWQHRRSGFAASRWLILANLFVGLSAIASMGIAGFQMGEADFLYTLRRIFLLLFLLFSFFTAFHFPDDRIPPILGRERYLVIGVIGLQILLLSMGFFLHTNSSDSLVRPNWFRTLPNLLDPLILVWLICIFHRRARALRLAGEEMASAVAKRLSIFFGLGIIFPLLTLLQNFISNPASPVFDSYGLMLMCVFSALILLRFQRKDEFLRDNITLLVLLFLLLLMGLVAGFFEASLGENYTLAEVDHVLRPFILIQLGIAAFTFLILPRILDTILPEPEVVLPAEEENVALTPRQREVMRLLAQGASNQEIALQLHITERTAKHHVSALMKTLSKGNRYELGELARGLLDELL